MQAFKYFGILFLLALIIFTLNYRAVALAEQAKSTEKKLPQVTIHSICFDDNRSDEILEIQKSVNNWLAKYPEAKITWLQSQNGYGTEWGSRLQTRLTAIITY